MSKYIKLWEWISENGTDNFQMTFDEIEHIAGCHMDIVPSVVNRLAHLLFFLFMDFTIIITSRYMYDLLIGYDKTAQWKKVLLNLPGMISVLLTAIFPTILLLGIYIGSENPSIRQLEMRSDEMLDGFATLVENKDSSTGGHIKRIRAYVNLILGEMKDDRHYRDVMCRDYMENVRMTLEDSFSIIEQGIGTDFDPHLAQIFLDNKDEVIELMKQFKE